MSTIKSEFQKMRDFEWYDSEVPELIELRKKAFQLFREFNKTDEDLPSNKRRQEIIMELFGSVGENVGITPPFYCDYGKFIFLGKNVFMNFGCTILDGCDVKIGDNVMIGPNCHIYTVFHPMDHEERNKNLQNHKPVTIGNNVWFGGGVIVLPGVTIGDNCVIGAGSLVNKNIPSSSFACGNPCKVVKQIKQNQSKL